MLVNHLLLRIFNKNYTTPSHFQQPYIKIWQKLCDLVIWQKVNHWTVIECPPNHNPYWYYMISSELCLSSQTVDMHYIVWCWCPVPKVCYSRFLASLSTAIFVIVIIIIIIIKVTFLHFFEQNQVRKKRKWLPFPKKTQYIFPKSGGGANKEIAPFVWKAFFFKLSHHEDTTPKQPGDLGC